MTIARRAWNLLLEALALALLAAILVFTLASREPIPETSPMQTPSIGRVVLFAFLDQEEKIVERPAEIVHVWPAGTHGVNLVVKLDGTNDLRLAGVTADDCKRLLYWATSIAPADDQEVPQVGRYRWPPRVK